LINSPTDIVSSRRAPLLRREKLRRCGCSPTPVSSVAAFWMWIRRLSTTMTPLSASSRRLREKASGVIPMRAASTFLVEASSTVVSPASARLPPASSTR